MATEEMQFPWRLNRSTISTNLEPIWEKSVNLRLLTVKPGFVATKTTEGMDLPKKLTAPLEGMAKDIFQAQQKGKDGLYTKCVWSWVMLTIKNVTEYLLKKGIL